MAPHGHSAVSGALDEHIEAMKRREDSGSPFYRQVLVQASRVRFADGCHAASQDALRDLSGVVDELENKQRENSRTLRLTGKLKPFVDALCQFVGVADVAIQAGPAAATIAYAGARFLLQLVQSFSDCLSLVLDTLREIQLLLKAYAGFTEAYHHDADMRTALKDSYKNILDFWQESAKLFTRKPIVQLLRGVTQAYQKRWSKYQQTLQADKTNIMFLAQSKRYVYSKEDKQGLLTDLPFLQVLINVVEMSRYGLSIKDSTIKNSLSQCSDLKRIRCEFAQWITGPEANQDVRLHLDDLENLRTNGTCQWLLDSEQLEVWHEARRNSTVWLSGAPGVGKSFATAALVSSLRDQGSKLAYFFCSFREPSRRCTLQVLKSLTVQLLAHSPDIPDEAMRIYESEQAQFRKHCENQAVLARVFHALLRQIDRIHIILDGLDECQCHNHASPVQMMQSLLELNTHGLVKWFCSSRRQDEFPALFGGRNDIVQVQPSKEESMQDISIYLKKHPGIASDQEAQLQTAKEASNGNFLIISLTAKILAGDGVTSKEDIEKKLAQFPTKLNEFFGHVLRRIMKREKEQRQLASQIFMLVTYSTQPLSMREIREAIAARPDTHNYSEDRMPADRLIEELCSPLIELHPSKSPNTDPTLQPYHASVRDFFRRDPKAIGVEDDLHFFFVGEKDANRQIGTKCLAYLSYKRYREIASVHELICERALSHHAFLKYASVYWHRHLQFSDHDQKLFDRVETFMRSHNFWTCIYMQRMLAPHLFAKLIAEGTDVFRMSYSCKISRRKNDDIYFGTPIPSWLTLYGDRGNQITRQFVTWCKEWYKILAYCDAQDIHLDPTVIGSNNVFAPLNNKSSHARMEALSDESTTLPFKNLESARTNEVERATSNRDSNFGANDSVPWSTSLQTVSTLYRLKQHAMEVACNPEESHTAFSSTLGSDNFQPSNLQRIMNWFSQTSARFGGAGTYEDASRAETGPNAAENNGRKLEVHQAATTCVQDIQGTKLISYTYRQPPKQGQVGSEEISSSDEGYASASSGGSSESEDDSPTGTKHREHVYHRPRSSGKVLASSQSLETEEDEGSPDWETSRHQRLTEQRHVFLTAEKDKSPLVTIKTSRTAYTFHSSCALDEKRNRLIWSPSLNEIAFANGRSSAPQTRRLDAPSWMHRDTTTKITAVRKEHFISPSSSILHILTLTARCSNTHVDFNLTLHSLPLVGLYAVNNDTELAGSVQSISHTCMISLDEQLLDALITSWTAHNAYVILPVLAPSPRVVRFALEGDTPSSPDVLAGRLDLPASAPARSPVLFISLNAGDSADEAFELYLASDAGPGLRITWSASDLGGWRSWDAGRDARNGDSSDDVGMRRRIKGSFVDAEKRFKIPVRSGLDWTIEAFLSCW